MNEERYKYYESLTIEKLLKLIARGSAGSPGSQDRDCIDAIIRKKELQEQANKQSKETTEPSNHKSYPVKISLTKIAETVIAAFLVACLFWVFFHYFEINLKP